LLTHTCDHLPIDMASPIYKPRVIHLEAVATYLFADLPISTSPMTPRSINSGIATQPGVEVNTLSEARSIARILHAHYGAVPAEFTNLLAGGVTVTNGIETISDASKAFRSKPLKDLVSSVLGEKMGKNTFFQAYVRGMVSTENFKTLVRNYNIQAHICTMPVANESTQARNDRIALGAAYTSAAADATCHWIRTYRIAYEKKQAQFDGLSANKLAERVLCQRHIDLYKERMDSPPAAGVNLATLNNAAAVRAALHTPLFSRSPEDRSSFWQVRFTADVFASFMQESKSTVDIR
jgi:hypothetical protein